MNINIPVQEGFVRLEYMNQLEQAYVGRFVPVEIFGLASIPGQTPLFHVLADDGGIYWRLPIHALCWREDAVAANLEDLVLWDSFSYHVSVCIFDLLRNKKMSYGDALGKEKQGSYQFTVDWFGDDGRSYGFAEVPGQHKCGHFLRLDDGNFALQPNNRLTVHDPNFVTKQKGWYPRKIAAHLFSVEQRGWRTSDDERYDYGVGGLSG